MLDQLESNFNHNIDQNSSEQSEYSSISIKSSEDSENIVIENGYIELWQQVLEYLEKKLRKPSFDTWIRPTQLIKIESDTATIAVKNEFTRNFLLQSYYKEIQEALKEILAKSIAIKFIVLIDLEIPENQSISNVENEKNFNDKQISLAEIKTPNSSYKKHSTKLNSKFNFLNFILGKSNQAPYTFAKAITESSSGVYSSLFIHSDTGLGKTHLLHAIGNQAQELQYGLKVKYVKAEDFTNELIVSIQRNNTAQFRSNYRNLDLLLFDDFHFLDNKKTCQEEFAFTLESIIENGGKVVMSSAKMIEEFKTLSNKLKSKIRGSLISTIEKPNYTTRLKILSEKANISQIQINEEHLGFIAGKFENNVRELEGALMQISAFKNFAGESIDDDLIANLFGGIAPEPEYKGLSIEKITKKVAEFYDCDLSELIGKSRVKEIANARHLAIYLAHTILRLSYTRIGDYFAGRKHSSIIHSASMVRKDINSDNSNSNYKYAIEQIKKSLSV